MSTAALLNGEIRNGRHTMPVRVYYEDTDLGDCIYPVRTAP